jgi:hypothetical protein
MERAGTSKVARSGATWRVGSGDGIGARRGAGTAFACVARAGVDVRARRTDVRLRVLFGVVRALFRVLFAPLVVLEAVLDVLAAVFFFAADFMAEALPFRLAWPFAVRFATARTVFLAALFRVFVRTAPVVFLRDAAAFNCFPLSGFVAPALEQDAQEPPGSVSHPDDSSRGVDGESNIFYLPDPELWTGGYDRT